MWRPKAKLAFVTRAAGGIGAALAYGLAEEGARVVIAEQRGGALRRLGACGGACESLDE